MESPYISQVPYHIFNEDINTKPICIYIFPYDLIALNKNNWSKFILNS